MEDSKGQEIAVEIKEHVAEIVSAYLRKNHVSADQLTPATNIGLGGTWNGTIR